MIKNIFNVLKYILSKEFIDDSINSYNKRTQNKIDRENLKIKLREIRNDAHGNDIKLTDEVFKLPRKEFQLFIKEYRETYDLMVKERRKGMIIYKREV